MAAELRDKYEKISEPYYWISNEIDLDNVDDMVCPHERPISNIKIAFTWSLYYLKNNFSYEDAMRDIVKRGGETESNAAIVGAMIGASGIRKSDALEADSQIPNDMI